MHIHQNPVCDAPDFKGAGGHFNPDGKHHGYQNPMGHHNGDMPGERLRGRGSHRASNLRAASRFRSTLPPRIPSFCNGGTSIVVHAKADDQKTDPERGFGKQDRLRSDQTVAQFTRKSCERAAKAGYHGLDTGSSPSAFAQWNRCRQRLRITIHGERDHSGTVWTVCKDASGGAARTLTGQPR